jgi:hypothetical protein
MTAPLTPESQGFAVDYGPAEESEYDEMVERLRLIEAAAIARYAEGITAIVKRTANMGGCSQTHHWHLSLDAARLLAIPEAQEAKGEDPGSCPECGVHWSAHPDAHEAQEADRDD